MIPLTTDFINFIHWLENTHVYNPIIRKWYNRHTMLIHTTEERWTYWHKNIKDMEGFKTHNWYTCDFGLSKVTFYCHVIDGEYLFPTENINKEGYSKLLCRPATNEEILNANYSPKK